MDKTSTKLVIMAVCSVVVFGFLIGRSQAKETIVYKDVEVRVLPENVNIQELINKKCVEAHGEVFSGVQDIECVKNGDVYTWNMVRNSWVHEGLVELK